MNKKSNNKRKRWLLYIFIPLAVLSLILSYYQFFYQSPRVDNGLLKPGISFPGHGDVVTAVRFSPNDSFVVSASVDSTIKVWATSTGEVIQTIKQPSGVPYMDLSSDGKYVVTGSYDSKVRIYSLDNGALYKEFAGHSGTVWTVAFSPDGKKVASAGDDKIIRIWDVATGQLLHQLPGHQRIIWSARFSPDGTKLASCSFDGSFKIWNVADGKLILNNTAHTETVVDVSFSHDGKMLASTSDDKTIKLWNTANWRLVRTMKVAEHVQAVAFSPDDQLLLTGGRDKPMIGELLQNFLGDSRINKGVSARLWSVKDGVLLQTFTHHANDVNDVAFSHDGKYIATASADRTVDLWRFTR
jgi:WD40 repeat protein